MKFQKYLKQDLQDTFFKIEHISNKSAFMKDCMSKAYRVWTDELSGRSLQRTKTDKNPEEVIDIAKKASYSHYVFILRNSFGREKPYIEAGIRTNCKENGKDYFLWINIKPEKLEYFINKYKLEVR